MANPNEIPLPYEDLARQVYDLVVANQPTMGWADTDRALQLAGHNLRLRTIPGLPEPAPEPPIEPPPPSPPAGA
jgi:hypothetical protein